MSTNGAPPNDTGEAVPKRNNEFYIRTNPLGGTWIHAQARLRVALLGPREEEPEGESEEESEQKNESQNESTEDEEESERKEESQNKSAKDKESHDKDTDEEDEFSQKVDQFSIWRKLYEAYSWYKMSSTTVTIGMPTRC